MSESEETRGMTLRELVLEVRTAVNNHIEKGHAEAVTWRGFLATLITIGGIIFGAIRIF